MRHLFGTIVLLSCCAILWTGCEKEETKACTASFIDERDGTEYCMVTLGNQTWMAENLQYDLDSGSYYNVLSSASINEVYGNLYTFEAANRVCPTGWHLPTDDEWKTLEMTLGMSMATADGINLRGANEGTQLKSIERWDTSAMASLGTNAVGFNALPAGNWNPSYGPFFDLGTTANFWTATVYDTTGGAWSRSIEHNQEGIRRTYVSQKLGYSCRCVKD